MFERVTGASQYGLAMALSIGQSLVRGQERNGQALDNIVERQRAAMLTDIESDYHFYASERRDETPAQDLQAENDALIEVAALRDFCASQGPTCHEAMQAVDTGAPPEPYAVHTLMFNLKHAAHTHRRNRE